VSIPAVAGTQRGVADIVFLALSGAAPTAALSAAPAPPSSPSTRVTAVRRSSTWHPLGAALWLGMAGCSGSCARSEPPHTSPTPARGAQPAAKAQENARLPVEAKLAYAEGRALCVRAARPSGLGEARCAETKDPIEQALWLDRERIAALVEGFAVVLLEREGSLRELPMPPPTTWHRPPPLDGKGKLQFGAEPSTRMHLYLEKGALWMARCPWWFPFDAGYCHAWVEARLWPVPMAIRSREGPPPGFKETPRDLPAGVMPADVKIEVISKEGEAEATVICRRGQEHMSRVEERGGAHMNIDWSWIGESPSSYVLRVERDHGEAVLWSTYWMEACRKDPIRELGPVLAGPDLFWIHSDERRWTVRYGEREVGSLEARWAAFTPGD
jgi:hypothetical protein